MTEEATYRTDRRKRVLTDADIEALRECIGCQKCAFSAEEVQFVKGWLETAKVAKSEFIKAAVKGVLIVGGLICGIITAAKMGYFK